MNIQKIFRDFKKRGLIGPLRISIGRWGCYPNCTYPYRITFFGDSETLDKTGFFTLKEEYNLSEGEYLRFKRELEKFKDSDKIQIID